MRRVLYLSLAAVIAVVAVVVVVVVRARSHSDAVSSGATPAEAIWSPAAQRPANPSSFSPSPGVPPSPTASPVAKVVYPTLRAPKHTSSIKVSGTTLFGWTLVTAGGSPVATPAVAAPEPALAPGASGFSSPRLSGSANMHTTRNTVESMIKGWIAADWLRREAEAGKTPTKTQLNQITLMIINSNNQIAQEYYHLGGGDALMKRLISTCDLRDTVKIKPGYWSYTELTPADAARYGECLADGRAAGPQWTGWLLKVMTRVRGDVDEQKSDTVQGGRWGIIDGLPKSLRPTLSMKNGWTKYVDGWHVNCLGIGHGWVLAVMIRTATLEAGDDACASVTRQLVVTK